MISHIEEEENWRKIAFSYKQIEDFLKIAILSRSQAIHLFGEQPELLCCYGTGFYFFIQSIQTELSPHLAEKLHCLACRVEQTCFSNLEGWDQNAADAYDILENYFK